MFTVLKEPVIQFLLAGLALHLGLSWLYPQDDDPSTVVVSQQAMQEFVQYRKKAFNQESAGQYWQSLTVAEQEELVGEYLRDELLFREAQSLGLDANDQIIRQRMIRKVEFLVKGVPEDQVGPSDEEMRAYFASNRTAYSMPATATFTHVFLSKQRHTPDELKLKASDILLELTQAEVPFEKASKHGDAFHFHRNYVGRDPLFVSSHFGAGFSNQLFEQSETDRWLGPFESRHGLHIVMLRKLQASWIPEYEDVAGAVLADMRKTKQQEARRDAFERIADKYTVEYLDITEPSNGF